MSHHQIGAFASSRAPWWCYKSNNMHKIWPNKVTRWQRDASQLISWVATLVQETLAIYDDLSHVRLVHNSSMRTRSLTCLIRIKIALHSNVKEVAFNPGRNKWATCYPMTPSSWHTHVCNGCGIIKQLNGDKEALLFYWNLNHSSRFYSLTSLLYE